MNDFNNLDVESRIELDKYQLREYQCEMYDAIENKGYKKGLFIWPRRCLSGDTHILMSDLSYKLLRDVRPGDIVLSYTGIKFVPDVVKNAWSPGVKQAKVFKPRTGLPITSSLDHQFLTYHEKHATYLWKKLGIINDTTKYVVPQNIGITSSFIQFKVELRGPSLDFDVKSLIINPEAQQKGKK